MRTLTFNRIIGVGAMGTVYHADLRLPHGESRPCAVKVMKTTNPDQEHFRARMRDEARLLGMLQDEQILGASELVRVDGHDCVVMEYVEGVDLGDLIRERRVPPRALAELGAQLAGTMHRAHSAVHPATGEPLRVIHRDVKPANVMITVGGVVRLLDFGVARAAFASRESQTQGLVLGTLNYFPPEILAGAEPTPAVDLYGLGLTLWECASGRDWGTPQVHRHRFERRVEQRLAEMGEAYESVAAVLRRLLAWRPEDRPNGHQVERLLLTAAGESSGATLRSWAREAVPPVLSLKQADTHWKALPPGTRPGRELIGRTVPIEGGTLQGLEQIDERLLKKSNRSVTETFNDLAPPAAVVRSRDRGAPLVGMDLVTERVMDPARSPPPAPWPPDPPRPPDPGKPLIIRERTTGSHRRTSPSGAGGSSPAPSGSVARRDPTQGPSAPGRSAEADETNARVARVTAEGPRTPHPPPELSPESTTVRQKLPSASGNTSEIARGASQNTTRTRSRRGRAVWDPIGWPPLLRAAVLLLTAALFGAIVGVAVLGVGMLFAWLFVG